MPKGGKPRHGHAVGVKQSPTYRSWHTMLTRCRNPNATQYPYYGGRGIKVCEQWGKFDQFLADMGVRPDGMSLDRIDPNGGYSPDNCRWVTRKQQSRNTRSTVVVTWNGETMPLFEWAEKLGIKYGTLYFRFSRWGVERAFTQAMRKSPSRSVAGEAKAPQI